VLWKASNWITELVRKSRRPHHHQNARRRHPTKRNLPESFEKSGARELHVAALVDVEGPMKYRNSRCFMEVS